jgi:hypothetical protein
MEGQALAWADVFACPRCKGGLVAAAWCTGDCGASGVMSPGSRAHAYSAEVTGAADRVRLTALVAGLSLEMDLGLGQPQHHIIRRTLIATRVAELEQGSPAPSK